MRLIKQLLSTREYLMIFHNKSMTFSRPSTNNFQIAWRRLTIIRIFWWLGRLFKSIVLLLGEAVFKIIRFLGLFLIEIAYGLKLKFVDWKYAEKKNRLQFRSALFFLFSAVWVLPKAVFHFFSRLGKLGFDTAERSQAKVITDTHEIFKIERTADFKPSFSWSLVNFVLTLLLIISPILIFAEWRNIEVVKNRVLVSGTTAFNKLFSAKGLLEERNIPEAQNAFSDASQNFIIAQSDLSSVNSFLFEVASVLPNKSARLAASSKHLITAGQLSADLGNNLSRALKLPDGKEPSVSNFINNFLIYAEPSLPIAKKLEKEMTAVDVETLPPQYQVQFKDFSGKTAFLVSSLEESIRLAKEASIFLGDEVDKRYMLVFQNNSEKRGPGGFMGSFALVDLRRGQIAKLTVPKGGTYDTEAGLSEIIAAPEPLRLLNSRWHFWDANWWPDWSMSAQKVMWFYENSNGPSVDGVISLTPTVIERALEIIGPIDMTADYGVIIDANNFWTTTQTFSEQKPNVTREPKKIIGDLINHIIEELPKRLTPEKTIQLISLLEKNLNEKQILAYFNDPTLEKSVQRFGWSGEIKETKNDYVMVVNTNIGGQKTDRVIKETLEHKAKILPDGSIIDTLTIRRQHTGMKGETFVGVRNVDWLRVYVPLGSKLISASGFEIPDASLFEGVDPKAKNDPDLEAERAAIIDTNSQTKVYQEKDKTVFANWSMVDPGETAILTVSYQLPFKVIKEEPTDFLSTLKRLIQSERQNEYSLLVQKQPGALNTTLRSNLEIVDQPKISWYYPKDLEVNNGWLIERPLDNDFFSAILFK